MANVAIVGATGLVGTLISEILDERNFEVDNLMLCASERSAGKEVVWRDKAVQVQDLAEADFSGCDVVLMSAGGDVSRQYAEKIAANGATVIDNSSAWRSDPDVPLVVTEVNPETLSERRKGIIANPNCTTMVAAPVLNALKNSFGLANVVATSFQSVSGSGAKGVNELQTQIDKVASDVSQLERDGSVVADGSVYAEPIAFNVIPLAGELVDDETDEEHKFRNETKRILDLDIPVSCTCVRVPVVAGHSLSISATLGRAVEVFNVVSVLDSANGVQVDSVPTPLKVTGGDQTLVGRIRRDMDDSSTIHFFIAGDNLRKGAALNAVQIAELLV